MTPTVPGTTKERPAGWRRRALTLVVGFAGGTGVCIAGCVLVIVLFGGGTVAVADGLVRESWLLVLGGLVVAGGALGYQIRRSRRARHR